jgi:hypothetical protein
LCVSPGTISEPRTNRSSIAFTYFPLLRSLTVTECDA